MKHQQNQDNNYQGTPADTTITSTPQYTGSHDHSFTLQTIMELQKNTGQLTEAINSLRSAIEKQESKIDKAETIIDNKMDKLETNICNRLEKVESSVSIVTHKIYAATIILGILVIIGGFIVNKSWDIMVSQLQSSSTSTELQKKPK